MPRRKQPSNGIKLYNKILKEFTQINNKLPEELKLSVKERRKVISEQIYPHYKGKAVAKVSIKEIHKYVLNVFDKLPPKQTCDIFFLPDSLITGIEWFLIDPHLSDELPKCVYVKVNAGIYGETKIFNTRNYNYHTKGVQDIVEEIRKEVEGESGTAFFNGFRKKRPNKPNNGESENYYLEYILDMVEKQMDTSEVEQKVSKTRTTQKIKSKVRDILLDKIKKLKAKKVNARKSKQTLQKNLKELKKIKRKATSKKNKKITHKQIDLKISRSVQKLLKQLDGQLEKGYISPREHKKYVKEIMAKYGLGGRV
jgi:hypothetical protein